MGYAKLREGEGTWEDQELRNLMGKVIPPEELPTMPTYVKSVCFDGMETGLYVLTTDDDFYFTCHSIVLDFVDEKPMEFHFAISKTETGKIIVQASDYDEAVARAHDVYHAGAVNWSEIEMSVHLERTYD